MKQLGNLAVVCAQRPDVLMQIYGNEVSVHVGEGPERINMRTLQTDGVANYKGRGAIGVKLTK